MNLYFAGASHTLSSQWINENQLNRLFSQELNRTEIATMCEKKRKGEYTGKIFIDSGAFTAHTKGIEVDVDEYITYLNSITDAVEVFAQVDKIPGQFGKPKSDQDLQEAPKLSWDNYLYMRPKLTQPEKLLPIYHQGEGVEWLRNMLEWTDENGNHIPYIGISPANDKSQKEKDAFIEMCFQEIKQSSNPNVQTHAFGMTNLKTLSRYPFTSADSSSWVQTAVNGGIMTKFGVVGMSLQSKNSNALKGKSPVEQQALRKYIESKGFDMDNLIEAPDDVVIDRILQKTEENIDKNKLKEALHDKQKAKGFSKSIQELIKFENGRSIKGEHDYKAYLERIRWDIIYLRDWSKEYELKPATVRRPGLLSRR